MRSRLAEKARLERDVAGIGTEIHVEGRVTRKFELIRNNGS